MPSPDRGARRRVAWLVAVAWSAAMLAVGFWAASSGLFGWRRAPPLRLVDDASELTPLAPQVRAALRPRMQRHGAAMLALTRATSLLDKPEVARSAAAVLADPALARPMTAEAAALQLELPPRFRRFDEELEHETRALMKAAQADDDEGMVAAQSRMAYVCARCHAAFAR